MHAHGAADHGPVPRQGRVGGNLNRSGDRPAGGPKKGGDLLLRHRPILLILQSKLFHIFVSNAPANMDKGLGDTIDRITTVTGIKSAVGKGCGCAKRREKLNKLFPYKK